MAEHLATIRRLAVCATSCIALGAAPGSFAENLFDPTRPVGEGDIPLAAGGQAPAASPVLQSILISRTRREAVIGAQIVRVGDRFGDAQVVQILEDRVVLRNEKEMQTLKLFPGIEKQKRATADHDEASAAGRHNNIAKYK